MKRLLWTITLGLSLLLNAGYRAKAQRHQPIRLRLEGSFNFSYAGSELLNWKDLSDNSIAGYRLGLNFDIPLGGVLQLSPGLAIVSKGATKNASLSSLWSEYEVSDFRVRTHFLQLPIYIGIRIPFFAQTGLSILAGPYFGYALHSEAYVTEAGVKSNYKDMIQVGWNNIKTNRVDLGLGATARLDLGTWYLTAGADLGGLRTFTNTPNESKFKNTTVSMGLGLYL